MASSNRYALAPNCIRGASSVCLYVDKRVGDRDRETETETERQRDIKTERE